MKLVIDIPEKTIAHIRSDYGHGCKGLRDEDREIIVNEIYKARMYVEFGAYINGYLKALEDKEWIPVSERLPEDRYAVLVYCPEYKNTYCAYYENNQWWIFGSFVQLVPNAVVAWMPLPEPYKGGEV